MRIPPLPVDMMEPYQKKAALAAPQGPMAIHGVMAHAPTVQKHYSAMAKAIFAELEVPPVERELAVLAVLFLERGAYEIAQHEDIARHMGISEAAIDAIREERYRDPVFSAHETALLCFTRQVVRQVRVDDATFDALAAGYSHRQIVELLFAIGSYMMIARITEVAETEIDVVAGAEVVRRAVRGAGQ